MDEDTPSSNAAECERPRGALRLPVMTAIGKAWLETLSARAEVAEEDNGPKSWRCRGPSTNWRAKTGGRGAGAAPSCSGESLSTRASLQAARSERDAAEAAGLSEAPSQFSAWA